jgi:hypothetical protein
MTMHCQLDNMMRLPSLSLMSGTQLADIDNNTRLRRS